MVGVSVRPLCRLAKEVEELLVVATKPVSALLATLQRQMRFIESGKKDTTIKV